MARGRSAAEHYAQAQRNEEFYRHIGGSKTEWPDWAATALFYTVLHEVEAALRSTGEPPSTDHTDRRSKLRSLSPALASSYESLKDLSQQARYHGVVHSEIRLALAETHLKLIRDEIKQIAPPPY